MFFVKGKYSPSSGATASSTCGVCGTGTYAVAGSFICASCAGGTFSAVTGATASSACTACAAGTYQASRRATNEHTLVTISKGIRTLTISAESTRIQ